MLAGALTQARDARLHILDVMAEAIDVPDEMSPFAPRIISVQVPVDKIGEVIGPKGKMINQIQDDTGADISIEDDGTVYIGATDGPSAEAARAAINAIANPQMPEVGERFLGTVVKTTTFGAFVSLLPGKDGLLHISEVRKLVGGKRIDGVDDVAHRWARRSRSSSRRSTRAASSAWLRSCPRVTTATRRPRPPTQLTFPPRSEPPVRQLDRSCERPVTREGGGPLRVRCVTPAPALPRWVAAPSRPRRAQKMTLAMFHPVLTSTRALQPPVAVRG